MKMNARQLLLTLAVVAVSSSSVFASAITDAAVTKLANRLVATQQSDGTSSGDPAGFVGPVAAGLAQAYQVTGTASYKTAAQKSADYIIAIEGGNYYGDEAYGLYKVSQIQANPLSNTYRTALTTFYNTAIPNSSLHTSGYINDLITNSGSASVGAFYVAENAVAAFGVNATDKSLWRQGIINSLALVEPNLSDEFQVQALGTAVWALANTGGIKGNTTLIKPTAASDDYWYGVTVADLPSILEYYQVTVGKFKGSIYEDLNASQGYVTEATIFGTLGLIAAQQDDPSLNLSAGILNGQTVLANALTANNDLTTRLDNYYASDTYHFLAGEALEALAVPEPTTVSTLLLSGIIVLARRRNQR